MVAVSGARGGGATVGGATVGGATNRRRRDRWRPDGWQRNWRLAQGVAALPTAQGMAAPQARPLTPLPPAVLTGSCARGGGALFAARRRCCRRSLLLQSPLGTEVPRALVGAVQVGGPAVAGPAGIHGACGAHRGPSAAQVVRVAGLCPRTHLVGIRYARDLYHGTYTSA